VRQITKRLKRLRFCNPYVVRRLAAGGGGVDEDAVVNAFNALGRLDAADIPGLREELPRYIESAVQLPDTEAVDEVQHAEMYWRGHYAVFPCVAKVVRLAYTYATSSAAAERVFSILKASFGRGQKEALGDYVSLSVMSQMNKR